MLKNSGVLEYDIPLTQGQSGFIVNALATLDRNGNRFLSGVIPDDCIIEAYFRVEAIQADADLSPQVVVSTSSTDGKIDVLSVAFDNRAATTATSGMSGVLVIRVNHRENIAL